MTSMKCHKCEKNAAIRMRQHRLALCKDHYLVWVIEQTERIIQKYDMFTHDQRILVAVSGGKDSLSLWDVLRRLNYAVDGIYIHLGIEGEEAYSNESERYAREYAGKYGLHLHIVNVPETYGESIPHIAERTHRGHGRPCAVCGLAKRHIMNQVAFDNGYDVLVTAHNLDDEAAVLFGNTMNWSSELLSRQYPVLKGAPGFVRKTKPFCRFYERETAAYAILQGIPYIYDECPYAVGSKQLYYKDLLNKLEEEHPGTKLRFYVGFLNARQAGLLAREEQPVEEQYAQRCPNCGQPTSAPGLCAFCRMVHAQTLLH
jgi:uncharacterized protein (TIGR00269 family)